MITIQFQDVTGNWVSAMLNVSNQAQVITARMKDVRVAHPNKRVRAIDSAGRLVDML